MYFVLLMIIVLTSSAVWAGPYAPAVGQPDSNAIPMPTDPNDVSVFVGWATGITVERGLKKIDDPSQGYVSHGSPNDALGFPQAQYQAIDGVVSLGDGGVAVLMFDNPIANGPGYDFAVFENALNDTFLELGFVEVSSDGVHYERFPVISLTQTESQVPPFGYASVVDTTNIHNFAGKYRGGYGTPFDLEELSGLNDYVDVAEIRYVRVVDAVGTLLNGYERYDSQGNIINDPWPTDFSTGGFDLDAVGVIHEKTLSADINGDGSVNLEDYAEFSVAYLSDPTGGHWNYKCDLAPFVNEQIDFNDFLVLTRQWLSTEKWYVDDVIHEKTLVADINDDGIVNLKDYAEFSGAYLSDPTSGHWNYKCDLAPFVNEQIDFNDFLVLIRQWLLKEKWYSE